MARVGPQRYRKKQDMQCSYTAKLRRVLATIVAVENQ